jgi:cholesterol transport system auxiliary component
MMPAARRRSVIALPLALIGAACGSILPKPAPSDLYSLTPLSGVPADLPEVGWQLLVAQPSVAGGLDGTGIAVRPSPLRLEYYAGARWVEPTPQMLQHLVITSFQNSGRIKAVESGSINLSRHLELGTNLVRFAAVYAQGAGVPEVQVELNATLTRQPSGEVAAARRFDAQATPKSAAVPDVVRAFDDATGRVLQELVTWTLRAHAGS